MCCGNKPKLDGNLLHLERYQDNANTPQATLDFSYIGPKRVGYAYDTNGNITYDPLRCFDIRYNLLNLASEVISHDPEESADSTTASEDDGTAAANETSDGVLLSETVYYADGTRAGVKTPDDGYWTTRYIGSLIYEGEPGQETLEGVITDNGFIQWNGSAANSRMQYFLRDHLGSVRVIAEDRHTVISRTDYLPFGVRMSGDGLTGVNSTARSSFFGFSGKENEMWGGYDTADGDITPHWLKGERYQHFGARAYDPVSCIFMQVDPMAEKYYEMTPYGYCLSSPLLFSDTDGQDAKVVVKRNRILVKSTIILFGQNTSYRTALQIKHRIETAWNDANKTFIDDKIVRFDIKVKHSKTKPLEANNGMTNYINLINDNERARIINSQEGTMSVTSAAHEFGHIIGLKDRYDTVVKDGQRYSVPHDGYEGTIMAEPSGFGVVIPEDVQSAIKLCVPSGCKKGIFYINKSNSQIAKQHEE